MKPMTNYTAIIQKEEDLYVATCPEIGTVSQGRSIEEAMENLREATQLYVEEISVPSRGSLFMGTFDVRLPNKTAGEQVNL